MFSLLRQPENKLEVRIGVKTRIFNIKSDMKIVNIKLIKLKRKNNVQI